MSENDIVCRSTSDCLNVDNSVLKHCFNPGTSEASCDCELWYGFSGENCTESSTQTDFFSLTSLMFLLVAIPTLFWSVYGLFKIIRFIYFTEANLSPSQRRRNREDPKILIISIFSVLGMVFMIVHLSLIVLSIFDPDNMRPSNRLFVIGGKFETIISNNQAGLDASFMLGYISMTVCCIFLSLSWLDLLKTITFRSSLIERKKILKLRNVGLIILSVVFLLASIFLFVGFLALSYIFLAITTVLVFLYVRVGRQGTLIAFDQLSSHALQKLEGYQLILKRTSIVIMVFLNILNISLIGAASQLKLMYEYVSSGELNLAVIFYQVGIFSILGILFMSIRYIDHQVKSSVELALLRNGGKDSSNGPSSGKNTEGQIHKNTYTRRQLGLSHPLIEPVTISKDV